MDNINESSLNRIYDFYKNEDFGIVTSWKQKTPDNKWVKKSENNAKFSQLQLKIRDFGFGFVSLIGVGQEVDPADNKEYPQKEPSLLIPNRKYDEKDFHNGGISKAHPISVPFDDFRDMVCMLGALDKNNPQYAVVVRSSEKQMTYMLNPVDKSVMDSWSGINFNKLAKYYSVIRGEYTKDRAEYLTKKGKTLAVPRIFKFESLEIAKIPRWEEAVTRRSSGELFELRETYEDEIVRQVESFMEYFFQNPKKKIYSIKGFRP